MGEEEEEAYFRARGIRAEFGEVHDRNIGAFRRLTEVVLPVRYSDEFYKGTLAEPAAFRQFGACTAGMRGKFAPRPPRPRPPPAPTAAGGSLWQCT